MTPHAFTRDELILGGRRGGAARRDRSRRIREERESSIVRIVRRRGLLETIEVYRTFLQVCVEVGWRTVSYRTFSIYIATLEDRGLLRRTVIVGHGGTFSTLEAVR